MLECLGRPISHNVCAVLLLAWPLPAAILERTTVSDTSIVRVHKSARPVICNDALGGGTGKNSLTPQYTEIYTKLVMDASKNYGSDLHVFMACGPMSEVYCSPIQNVIKTVQAHGVKAHFLDQVLLATVWFARIR